MEGIVVKAGNANLLVKWEEILYCYVDGEYVKLVTLRAKGISSINH